MEGKAERVKKELSAKRSYMPCCKVQIPVKAVDSLKCFNQRRYMVILPFRNMISHLENDWGQTGGRDNRGYCTNPRVQGSKPALAAAMKLKRMGGMN